MRPPLALVFLILAMLLFLLAGIGIPEHPRFRYLGWGLFFWVLSGFWGRTP